LTASGIRYNEGKGLRILAEKARVQLLYIILLAGCSPSPEAQPTVFTPGVYTGWFSLELTAQFGLWESATEGCTSELTLIIEPDHDIAPIRGRVYCETATLSGELLDIQGDLSAFPLVNGQLSSAERSDAWEGVFLNEERLYAELSGSAEQNGVTVDYVGSFSACLDPDAERPGVSEPPDPGLSLGEEPFVEQSLLQ
jgi:hypothetical protein